MYKKVISLWICIYTHARTHPGKDINTSPGLEQIDLELRSGRMRGIRPVAVQGSARCFLGLVPGDGNKINRAVFGDPKVESLGLSPPQRL